jgi:thioredoxin 1
MKTIMYFTAAWCGPCKQMKPIIDKFIEDVNDPEIIKLDADLETPLAQKFKVMSVPTFILMDGEEEIKRHVGAISEQEFYDFTKYEKSI